MGNCDCCESERENGHYSDAIAPINRRMGPMVDYDDILYSGDTSRNDSVPHMTEPATLSIRSVSVEEAALDPRPLKVLQ